GGSGGAVGRIGGESEFAGGVGRGRAGGTDGSLHGTAESSGAETGATESAGRGVSRGSCGEGPDGELKHRRQDRRRYRIRTTYMLALFASPVLLSPRVRVSAFSARCWKIAIGVPATVMVWSVGWNSLVSHTGTGRRLSWAM